MKKIIIVLALLATGVCCRAQIDTLFLGDRNPVYYYWDTNWWDYYALLHKNDPDYSFNVHFFTDRYCKPEWARYCYTDSSLRIIGVAASMHIKILRDLSNPFDTIPDSVMISDVGTEHFRLYEVDSLTDSMMLLAEGLWSKEMQPSHYIINAANPSNTTDGLPRYKPVYEVYFDSAFTVSDSFYVAVTGNGFYRRYNTGHYQESYARAEVCNVLPQKYHTYFDDNECRPRPEHYRRKLHLLDEGNYDWRYGVTDTNWHTFGRFGYHPPDTSARWNVFMSIFPIIDTSTVVPPPDCRVPLELTTAFAGSGVATISWTGGNAERWEMSVCRDGCSPENGYISSWNIPIATITGLDTAQWYVARVRSVCSFGDSIYYSDWSDSLRFYVPGGTPDDPHYPESINTAADRYSHLMPNPASETVTVVSSFRIGEVELYSLDGRRLIQQKADGIQTTLDISSLPTGTYIVRISTNNGTAFKKLVVK